MTVDPKQETPARDGLSGKGAESIDQVRDLLFGAQMRTFDSQIQSLTDRMMKETAELRADLERRIADLQQNLERTAVELRAGKLDSAALASGLTELAKKLGERR